MRFTTYRTGLLSVILFSFIHLDAFGQPPTTQSSNVIVTDNSETEITLSWTNGNGDARIVAMFAGNETPPIPSDNNTFYASDVFTQGDQVGTGWYVVYNGNENSVFVSGLAPEQEYTVAVIEYNGSSGYELYNSTYDGPDNPVSFLTNNGGQIGGPTANPNALSFDGVDDYVSLGSQTMLNPGTGSYSVEFWFRHPTVPTADEYLLAQHGSGGQLSDPDLIQAYIGPDQFLRFGIRDANNVENSTSSGISVTDGQWHHVAAVRDVANSRLNLYLDGVLANSVVLTATADVSFSGNPLILGAREASGVGLEGYAAMEMDNLRLWKEALPENLIRQYMYTDDLTGHALQSTDLLAHYDFNHGEPGGQNSGISLTDQSGNGNDGTLYGFGLSGSTSNWIASTVLDLEPAPPTSQSRNIQVIIGQGGATSVNLTWTKGNGQRRIVAVAEGTPAFPSPADNVYLAANAEYGLGDALGDYYVIYNGYGTAASLTGLMPDSEYTIAVLEVNGPAGYDKYYSTPDTNNPDTFITNPPPPTDFFALENPDGTITFTWTDIATQETGYRIQKSTDLENWGFALEGTPMNSETVTSSALAENEQAWWRVAVQVNGQARTYSAPQFAGNVAPPGNAIDLDGEDDYLVISGAGDAFEPTQLTVEAWIYKKPTGSVIMSSVENFGWSLYFDGDNLALANRDSVGITASSVMVPDYEWHHVAFTFDGSITQFYLDGQYMEQQVYTPYTSSSNGDYTIGSRGEVDFSAIAVDELRIWDVALTDLQIADRVETTLAGNETNLVAYYRFDQTAGNILLPDRSANHFHGTWSGSSGTFYEPAWIPSGALVLPPDIDPPTILTVTNTSDSGPGSFRQALLDANASAVNEMIQFNIPGAAPWQIGLTSPLETITDTIFIDGTSQPGWNLATGDMVTIDGTNVTGNGLYFGSGSDQSQVYGLHIANFSASGIRVGTVSDVIIGGSLSGNVLGGNDTGIELYSSTPAYPKNIVIKGNKIGTNATGAIPNGNDSYGIRLQNAYNTTIGGDKDSGQGNLISGNGTGGTGTNSSILVSEGSNLTYIYGNRIGTTQDGAAAFSSTRNGVYVAAGSAGTFIGDGSESFRNIISTSAGAGVTASGDLVEINGNYIGVAENGIDSLGIATVGISCVETASGIDIKNNVISGAAEQGILADNREVIIMGNKIGTDASGSFAIPNGGYGIETATESINPFHIIIGGSGLDEGNLVSGNQSHGVHISGTERVTLLSNKIGTNATGEVAIPNTGYGLYIQNVDTLNATENTISGNAGSGIYHGATVNSLIYQGNYIGTTSDGLSALPNTGHGIEWSATADDQTIGGLTPGAGNIIAYNNGYGIYMTSGNQLRAERVSFFGNEIYCNDQGGLFMLEGTNFDVLNATIESITGTSVSGSGTDGHVVQVFATNDACDSLQSRHFLGYTTVASSVWSLQDLSLSPLDRVSILTTDTDGNSSNLSVPLEGYFSSDAIAPTVTSIVRFMEVSEQTRELALFTITFDEPVQQVDAADFVLNTEGGTAAGTINYATVVAETDDTQYTVQVDNLSGEGPLSLEFSPGQNIIDRAGNPFDGVSVAFAEGYIVDVTPPAIAAIERFFPASATTNTDSVVFRITMSENVFGVDTPDFDLSGTATGTISQVLPQGNLIYYVSVSSIVEEGFLSLTPTDSTGIEDFVGNLFEGAVNYSETYLIDWTAPAGYSLSNLVAENNELLFQINGGETGSTYDYNLSSDGGGLSIADSDSIIGDPYTGGPVSLIGLASGTLTLEVTLKDQAGNVGLTETASVAFVADMISIDGPVAPTVTENVLAAGQYTAAEVETWSVSGPDGASFYMTNEGELWFISAPDYEAPHDANEDNVYELEIQVTGVDGRIGILEVLVTVADKEDEIPPTVLGPVNPEVVENTTFVASYTGDEPLGDMGFFGVDGAYFYMTGAGELYFAESPDYENPQDADGDNVYEVTISISDLAGNYTQMEIFISVTDLEDELAPVGPTSPAVAENSTLVGNYASAEAVSFNLTGPDAALFSINIVGELSFVEAPDYEEPADEGFDNIYEVTIVAADAEENTAELAVAISVTDANDNIPVIASAGSLSVNENSLAGSTVVIMSATDADTNSVFTWTLDADGNVDVNEDGNLPFVIDETTGELTINDPDDINYDLITSFSLYVIVGDGMNATGTTLFISVIEADEEPPVVTLEPILTNNPSPAISGTVNDGFATVVVLVEEIEYEATNHADGNWSLPQGSMAELAAGSYTVQVSATDQAGNSSIVNAILEIDLTAPEVTIASLETGSTSPQLSGTINDLAAELNVIVNTLSYTPDKHADGTWTLAAATIETLEEGTYEISVIATDAANNMSTATASLLIDLTAPVVSIDQLLTNSISPALTGLIDDPAATVSVHIDDQDYTTTNHGDGFWTLAAGIIDPALEEGIYEITAIATDINGNESMGTGAVTVDLTAPTVTVHTLETLDDTPALSGLVSDADASVTVEVNGQTYVAVVNLLNDDYTWLLDNNTITSLEVGTYDVLVSATDLAGNVGTDETTDELVILPGAPEAVAASDRHYFGFTANWLPRSGVASYLVDVSADADFTEVIAGYAEFPTSQTSLVVAGLSYGTTYFYRVRAVYPSQDVSPGSNVIETKTPIDPGTVADSLALLTIYTATGGADWEQNNWTNGLPLANWAGVQQVGTRVVGLDLSAKGLTGAFPQIEAGLEFMEVLNLNNNKLTALPDLSGFTALDGLDVRSNLLEFGSLELNQDINGITYNPQRDSVGTVEETLEQQGTTYVINRAISGSSNTYTWYKEDKSGNVTELSGTGPEFSLPISDFSDEGNYFAHVTSSVVTDLELVTYPVIVKVSSLERDSTALRNIYTKLNGSTWTKGANWLTEPLADWGEITIANQRVTELRLPAANLTGELPRDILDIAGLRVVDLSGNKLSGIPDFSGLPNLTSLNVSSNLLDFGDLEKNMDVAGIIYATQGLIGISGNDTIPKGEQFTVELITPGTANKYQWKLRNDVVDRNVTGANSASYTIESIDYETMGRYTVLVTNELVPDLTLTSRAQQVWASAEMAFVGIGNDNAAINTGFGYALKNVGPNKPYDSAAVVRPAGGEFVFDLVLGTYLIAIEGDREKYLPTYFRNTFLWEEADTLQLRDNRRDTLYMTKVPGVLPEIPNGGVVRGFVESDFADDEEEDEDARVQARRKVKKAGCSMRRRTRGGGGRTGQEDVWELMAYVETNDDGEFEFGNLPDGEYRFNIEYPGIPMNPDSFVAFKIGADGVEGNEFTLEAYVTETGIEVIKVRELGFYREYFKDLSVYPNPADQVLNVSYTKLVSEHVQVQLLDLSGQVILQQDVRHGYGQGFQLDVSGLTDGMYLLNFIDPTNRKSQIIGYKIYVRH